MTGDETIHIKVLNLNQNDQFTHQGGPIEFGRGIERDVPRCVIKDMHVSRDHVRVEVQPDRSLQVTNLSTSARVHLVEGLDIEIGETRRIMLPLRMIVGNTTIAIDARPLDVDFSSAMMTIPAPAAHTAAHPGALATLDSLGDAPNAKTLAKWMEEVLALQRQAPGAEELYQQTAQALVELIGLDRGIVLLREGDRWATAAVFPPDKGTDFSESVLDHVLTDRRTFYHDLSVLQTMAADRLDDDAILVSPVFGIRDEVVAVLYGTRNRRSPDKAAAIRPLEAQVVQLLASAVGANLARNTAIRTRVRFEQFFSPELVQQLEHDSHLLDGRRQEVTVLISDLRGFSRLSERLGANETCRFVQDLMERLSTCITAKKGVIVDYAGDGILAMWNAPVKQEDHVQLACDAGLEMLGVLPGLSACWRDVVGQPLRLGIGVNTGPAVVGNTGSQRRFKYGPLGHTVNVASRVQEATKTAGVPMLITDVTKQRLPRDYATRRLFCAGMRGINTPVVLHQLVAHPPPAEWNELRRKYEIALSHFEQGQWREAQAILKRLDGACTGRGAPDPPTRLLLEQTRAHIGQAPPASLPIIPVGSVA